MLCSIIILKEAAHLSNDVTVCPYLINSKWTRLVIKRIISMILIRDRDIRTFFLITYFYVNWEYFGNHTFKTHNWCALFLSNFYDTFETYILKNIFYGMIIIGITDNWAILNCYMVTDKTVLETTEIIWYARIFPNICNNSIYIFKCA